MVLTEPKSQYLENKVFMLELDSLSLSLCICLSVCLSVSRLLSLSLSGRYESENVVNRSCAFCPGILEDKTHFCAIARGIIILETTRRDRLL